MWQRKLNQLSSDQRAKLAAALTPRQQHVFKLAGEGLRLKTIAMRLGVSVRTVEIHSWNISKAIDKANAGNPESRNDPSRLDQAKALLTTQESAVLALLVRGRDTKAIAVALGLSPRTIEFYRRGIMTKLRAATAVELGYMVGLSDGRRYGQQ